MEGNQYKISSLLRRAELIRYWLPALVWSVLLLTLSGSAGSSSITTRILALLLPPSSPGFEPVHFALRKTLHLVAYGLLGALDFRAVRGTRRGWTLRWSAAATMLALLVAALDEWHQSFVPGRSGLSSDVLLDGTGAALAQVGWKAFSLWPPRRAVISAPAVRHDA